MKHRKLLCALLAALLALAWGVTALAKTPSPSKEFYYYDEANVLSEATRGEIFFSNQLLNEACGAQIVIAAVKTTGSESIDNYAHDMFNAWGIGDAKANNGFLLVMAINDDDYYAECGYNLQPKFTSSALKQYFDDYLEDDFAAKRYDEGARKCFEAVFKRIADIYNADVTVEDGIAKYNAWKAAGGSGAWSAQPGGARGATSEGKDSFIAFATIMVILLIAVFMIISRSRRRRFVPPPPPPPMGGPMPGPGGYRGVNSPPPPMGGPVAGPGGYRGPEHRPVSPAGSSTLFRLGLLNGLSRSIGGSSRPSGGSRSSGPSRSSGGFRSFGSSHGGGGRSGGGGAGRGRH